MRRYATFEDLLPGTVFRFREGVLGNILAERDCQKVDEETYTVLLRQGQKRPVRGYEGATFGLPCPELLKLRVERK